MQRDIDRKDSTTGPDLADHSQGEFEFPESDPAPAPQKSVEPSLPDPIRDSMHVPPQYGELSTVECLKEIYNRAERRLRGSTPSSIGADPALKFDWDRLRARLDFNSLFLNQDLDSQNLARLQKIAVAMWQLTPIDQEIAEKIDFLAELIDRPGVSPIEDEDRALIRSAVFQRDAFSSGKGGELSERELATINQLYHGREELDARHKEINRVEKVRLKDSDLFWMYNPKEDRVEVSIGFGAFKDKWLLQTGSPTLFEEWISRPSPESVKEIARAGLAIWKKIKDGGNYEDKAAFRDIFAQKFLEHLQDDYPGWDKVTP